MGLVVRDQPQVWIIELTRFHGPNIVICEVVTDRKCTLIIGAYLPPSTLEHLPDLEKALTRFQDQYPIVVGDLNSDLGQSQNPHIQQVSALLLDVGLMGLLCHFRQHGRVLGLAEV